jgi:hypothetical protein
MLARRNRKPDPAARRISLAIGASRIAIGAAIFLATRPALKGMGFGATDSRGKALAKLGGGRDIALGVVTLAVRDDPSRLRGVMLAASACDVTDALALGISARDPELRLAGLAGVLSGSAAAVAGFWAASRLGD